ncbi:MAG: hypothetical protein PHX70_11800 [Clostridium sp.]|nr:hypothetical protein [Clostridium sp.]
MKTRKNLIIFCLIILIIAGIGTALYKNYFYNIDSISYLSNRDESEKSFDYLGNEKSSSHTKSFNFKNFNGKWSLMQFSSNKNNNITINDSTKIASGKFYIVVLDSKYNIAAKKNEVKRNGNIRFTTPKAGKYIVRIIGAHASGNFNITISSTNDIKISYINFYN